MKKMIVLPYEIISKNKNFKTKGEGKLMDEIEKILQEKIAKNRILKDEPMSKHTSFKIGGNAEYFIKIQNTEELKFVLKLAKDKNIPIQIVGNGTNLLVKDGGIDGFVIKLELNDFKIKKFKDEIWIIAGAGITLATLSGIALREELTGLEFLSGIPGTIGGAIRMNAGAYGGEMKDVVVRTKYMTYDGKIKTIDLDEHKFEYRKSIFSELEGIILETTIKTKRGNKQQIEEKIKEYNTSRKEKQPLEYPNAGSTFKRKENIITAKLIDEAGLKGYNIGDAEVSTKHAGFIINKGKATAKEVLELVEYVKKQIKEKFNEEIELEILVIGKEQ